ncbi:MAG TPA: alpha/beta fold hydrolase, partial [Thermoanaerobaculia bacterium]|nr:alpha/beta fold hydrolase [Thermoanaerobaculia bacterium]
PLVVVGWSLGAAVAVQLAARRPGALDGVALLSPWSRLADTAAAHFPGFMARPLVGDRYDSLAAAPRITAPVLVMHGERDRIIPAVQGERLVEALAEREGVETRWVAVPGAGHNDLLGRGVVWDELGRLFDAAAAR